MKKMIEVSNLSKKYLIYHEQQNGYATLVETLANKAKSLFFSHSQAGNPSYEDFMALDDVSFSVEEGDRLGVIGKNGAGKSTLFKILARITEPTQGCVKIRKRISYLLEVGTGFHPELTGRENIYLNGAILGMSQKEIKMKFDSIVDFSGIEKFLDTPVKRYSSGMYTRLGFAVAAHLDPEILIVDEVLAVGDAQFQEKCLKKINDLSHQGRTILFVSHDIGSVLTLCNKGLYLEKGKVKASGSIEECVNGYMSNYSMQELTWSGMVGDEHIQFSKVSLQLKSSTAQFIYQGEMAQIQIEYEILKPTPGLVIGVGVYNQRNQLLAQSQTSDDHRFGDNFQQIGHNTISITINSEQFHEGDYLIKIECFISNKKNILSEEIILKFPVYKLEKNTHFPAKEGVSLGNSWVLNSRV